MLAPGNRCRTCEAMRRAARAAWHRVIGRRCIVTGCEDRHYPICRRHWQMLPLPLRRRWWDETGYSDGAPNAALVDAVNAALKKP